MEVSGNGFSTYYTPTYNIDQWHYNTNASLTNGNIFKLVLELERYWNIQAR